jgi:hypothetical protein
MKVAELARVWMIVGGRRDCLGTRGQFLAKSATGQASRDVAELARVWTSVGGSRDGLGTCAQFLANSAINLAMKYNQERKRKQRLSRVRPSQPPGRERRAPVGSGEPACDEVKGVCPESDPESRESLKFVGGRSSADGRRRHALVRDRRVPGHPTGITDSIESHRGYVATRRRAGGLGDEHPEYPEATPKGSAGENPPSGMGTGLAMKRGNSRGVKVPTTWHPPKEKHQHYTESGNN